MFRLSKYLEKLEDLASSRWRGWYARHRKKLPVYIPVALLAWYFYGMFLNSLRLGTAATFHTVGEEVESIWVFNPFRNWFVVFTPFGLIATLVIVLLICLITKKGYSRFSGYKYVRDPRGFDILPDGTHGTSGFLSEKEMRELSHRQRHPAQKPRPLQAAPAQQHGPAGSGKQAPRQSQHAGPQFYKLYYVNYIQLHHGV